MKEHPTQRWIRVALVLASLVLVGLGAAGVQWSSRTGDALQTVPANADPDAPAGYMPVGYGGPGSEAAELARLEADWNNRVTYPTGKFNPAWVRAAAAQDS